jgi:hypothetical protein
MLLDDETLKEMLYATGGDIEATFSMADRYGFDPDDTEQALLRINKSDAKLIPSLQKARKTAPSDATATADAPTEYAKKAEQTARYEKAEAAHPYEHAILPRAVEAVQADKVSPKEVMLGLAEDVATAPARAFWSAVGSGAEGYGKAFNSVADAAERNGIPAPNFRLPERIPLTDSANPEGLGNDASSIFTMVGGPRMAAAKFGTKFLKGAKAGSKLGKAAKKGAELAADFGAGYLLNAPFDNGIGAVEAAMGTGAGGVFGVASPILRRGKGAFIGKADDLFSSVGNKLQERGKKVAGQWMRPTKTEAFKNDLDLEVLLKRGPDGAPSPIQPGAHQLDVKETIDNTVDKMHKQRGELWGPLDAKYRQAYENGDVLILPKENAPLPRPVDMAEVGQDYMDRITDDVANGKLFRTDAQEKAFKFWEDRAKDAEEYAKGLGQFGHEQPYWTGHVDRPDLGFESYLKTGAEMPAGAERSIYVTPHQLQHQSNDLYETFVRNAKARAKKGEGVTPTDQSALRAYEAMSKKIAETTDDYASREIPGYIATRENYSKWLPWQHQANDKAREWSNDFWLNQDRRREPLFVRAWKAAKERTVPILNNEATAGKARQLYDLGEVLKQAPTQKAAENAVRSGAEAFGRTGSVERPERTKFGTDFQRWYNDMYGYDPQTQEEAEAYIRALMGE